MTSCEPVGVSIICPAWNRPDQLKRALRSLSRQSARDFEVIVVDDGSVPSLELEDCGDNAIALRILRHDRNRGAAAARNTGAEAARGVWLAFLDSDDEWYPAKLERQLAFAEQHHDPAHLQAFATGFDRVDYFARVTSSCIPKGAESLQELAAGCWYSPGTTILIRRETFLSLGGFDVRLSLLEDYEFFLRFGSAGGRVIVLPEILARIHKNDTPSMRRLESSIRLILKLQEKYENPRSVTRLVRAFCELAKGSVHYRQGRALRMAWCLGQSILLAPRRSIHLIDRFENLEKRVGAFDPLGEPRPCKI